MTTAPTSAGPTKDDTRREQPALLRLPYRSELWFVLFLAFFWPLIRTCRDVLLCPVVLCMIWFGAAGGSCCVLFQTRTVSFLCSPSSPCCGGIIPLVGGDTLQEFLCGTVFFMFPSFWGVSISNIGRFCGPSRYHHIHPPSTEG